MQLSLITLMAQKCATCNPKKGLTPKIEKKCSSWGR